MNANRIKARLDALERTAGRPVVVLEDVIIGADPVVASASAEVDRLASAWQVARLDGPIEANGLRLDLIAAMEAAARARDEAMSRRWQSFKAALGPGASPIVVMHCDPVTT